MKAGIAEKALQLEEAKLRALLGGVGGAAGPGTGAVGEQMKLAGPVVRREFLALVGAT